jgi:hypothetical protein
MMKQQVLSSSIRSAVILTFVLSLSLLGCRWIETDIRPVDLNPPRASKVRRYGREFQIERTKYFEIYFVPQHEEIAARAAGEVDGIYERLSEWFNWKLITPYKIFLLPDKRSIYRATGEMRDIGGAVTGRRGRLFVAAQHYNSRVIAHELTHIFLRRKLRGKPIPVWFNEGMAEYLSTQNPTAGYVVNFIKGKLKGEKLYSWKKLERGIMLRDPEVTYLEALSAVIFLSRRFGEEKIRELLELYSRRDYDKPFSGALSDVYHMSYSELEKAWMEFIKGKDDEGDQDR